MSSSFLRVENLGISLSGASIIQGMSFNIKPNALTTFLGPSGSGKTTVLRAIAGLNQNISGQIFLEGREIQTLPANQRDIGMVFQSYALFPNMTVFDNIAYGLRVKKKSNKEIEQKVAVMLETVGLADKKMAYPDNLSGGQQQRVAIARSMILHPKLLLLDEPLSALDAKIRIELRNQIRRYQQEFGITMLFVTHDQAEAMAISDDIIVMDQGKVQQQGSPMEIYAKPKNNFIAKFIGNHNLLTGSEIKQLGFKTIMDQTVQAQDSYIIRPELFEQRPSSNGSFMEISGKLSQRSVLGDRLQYVFDTAKHIPLKIEFLNQTLPLELNRPLKLYLNESAIQKVGD
jgi:putative spermidine/putrescine transport system ATP-binding protein